MDWQATVKWVAPPVGDVEAAMNALHEALTAHDPAVGAPDERDRWEVTISVEAGTLRQAASTALRAVAAALLGVDALRRGVLTSVEVVDDEAAERRLMAPTIPPLVNATTAAPILGVTRQRVLQLAASDRTFPRAVQEVGGPLWTKASVERYAATRDATPGRHKPKSA